MIKEKPYNIVPTWIYIGIGLIHLALICVFIIKPDYAKAEQETYDIGKEFEGCSWSQMYEACFCYDMRFTGRALTWAPHEVCVRAKQVGR